MIIKQIPQAEPVTNNAYEIFEEVPMSTPDGNTVTVLQLKETIYLEQLNSEITQLENEISSIQARLIERQSVLAEINNL